MTRGYFAYVEYERMLRGLPENDMQRPWLFDGEDQNRHLAAMPYGACAFAGKRRACLLGRNTGIWACALSPLPPGSGISTPLGWTRRPPCRAFCRAGASLAAGGSHRRRRGRRVLAEAGGPFGGHGGRQPKGHCSGPVYCAPRPRRMARRSF